MGSRFFFNSVSAILQANFEGNPWAKSSIAFFLRANFEENPFVESRLRNGFSSFGFCILHLSSMTNKFSTILVVREDCCGSSNFKSHKARAVYEIRGCIFLLPKLTIVDCSRSTGSFFVIFLTVLFHFGQDTKVFEEGMKIRENELSNIRLMKRLSALTIQTKISIDGIHAGLP